MLYATIPRDRTAIHVNRDVLENGQKCEGEFVGVQKTLPEIHVGQLKNISGGVNNFAQGNLQHD